MSIERLPSSSHVLPARWLQLCGEENLGVGVPVGFAKDLSMMRCDFTDIFLMFVEDLSLKSIIEV